MKLRRRHYLLMRAIFMCGLFTTFSSIAHGVFILLQSPSWIGATGHIEVRNIYYDSWFALIYRKVAISIFVSNLIVLVTYIYRIIQNMSNDDVTSVSDTESSEPPRHRTAVDANTTAPSAGLRSSVDDLELTRFSHLGTTFDIATRSDRTGVPISTFSFPSRDAATAV